MMPAFVDRAQSSVPLVLLTGGGFAAWRRKQAARLNNWVKAQDFKAEPGRFCLVPDAKGNVAFVLAGISEPASLWDLAALPQNLPEAVYHLDRVDGELATKLALGWALGSYRYDRYKKTGKAMARLVWPQGCDKRAVHMTATATLRARDLITTPAEDLGPAELAAAVRKVAKAHGAKYAGIVGDHLLKQNYPLIHTVGRASPRAPRLIDMRWGKAGHPLIAIVGKGVCFDTGGLDLKPSGAMLLMKKDMGGAATALALAEMVMAAGLKVRLRLLIPAVDNAVAGNAFRPMDVLPSRKGLTVEVGNTDAEGRLVLADALTEADREQPEMILDFATLTGAARSALGTELPALFCNHDGLASDLLAAGQETEDPLWRMPLWQPYRHQLDSGIADLNSFPNSPYAGAITAALFLERFIGKGRPWAHIDLMAWNLSGRPGRPEGGEAMGARAAFRMLEKTYG